MKIAFLAVAMLVILLATPMQVAADDETLASIRNAIAKKGAEWTAGETSVSRLSLAEQQRLVSPTPLTVAESSTTYQTAVPGMPRIPSHFDWRQVNGKDYTSPIKDQGPCGSCYIFGSVAVVESLLKMNNPASQNYLSEQFGLSCCSGCGDCGGGYPDQLFQYIETTGLPDEGCLLYSADDTVQCGSACANWQQRVTRIDGWSAISQMTVNNIKAHLLTYGPLGAEMEAYLDFSYYTGGIYEHVWGSLTGYHWVTIVGYDDAEGYWIVKNSWSTGWGENGWFRIRYGDSGIDSMLLIHAWMAGSNPGSISGFSGSTTILVYGKPAASYQYETAGVSTTIIDGQILYGKPGIMDYQYETES